MKGGVYYILCFLKELRSKCENYKNNTIQVNNTYYARKWTGLMV
jgi:hypothetical protein